MDSTQRRFGEFLVRIEVLTLEQHRVILRSCEGQPCGDYYNTAVKMGILSVGAIDAYFSRFEKKTKGSGEDTAT